MVDIFSREKRNWIMSRVRNKDTDIEITLRRALWKRGLRFRVKSKVFGKPDIVFLSAKVAVFCDGDFWHGRKYGEESLNYADFWKEKIRRNMLRDKLVTKTLENDGWRVFRFWKTDIYQDLDHCTDLVTDAVRS